eukprot:RCo029157
MGEVYRVFRVFKTVFEMLHDRGYLVAEQDLQLTLDRFRAERCTLVGEGDQATYKLRPRDQLWLLHHKRDNEDDKIFVFFPEDEKMGVKPVKLFHSRMVEQKVSRAIIVTYGTVTPFAKQAMVALTAQGLIIEHFSENELMVNITKHELVPQHIPLSDAEKKEFLQSQKLKEKDLPRIQRTDPVCCYFGLRKGQVFKIKRKSETAGTYITYRLVI